MLTTNTEKLMLPWKNLLGVYRIGHFCNKLRVSMLLLFLLGILPSAWGQQTNVTLNMKNVPIKSVLSQIEKATNYYVFFYTDNLNAELSKRVNVTVNDTPVVTVLNQIFSSTHISYEIKNRRQISLFWVEKPASTAKASPIVKSNKIQISGIVSDVKGEPLIGASVRVLGTTVGTMADVNGAYKLEVSPGDVLEASFIGYDSRQVKVGESQNRLNFVLREGVSSLDDIVVVGYSSQKKETVTGSISMVTTKDLLQSPQANISNALGGRIPGLLSVQRSGEPGQDMSTLRIRGVGTFASDDGSQDPLIMVDGIEVNNLNDIDPNEVESLSILKDASATAVYGVRGANGVILITTKRGELGKPKISFSTNIAITDFPMLNEPMNSYDYARAYNTAQAYDYYTQLSYNLLYSDEAIEAYRTGSDPLFYPDINWYDYMLKDFSTQTQTNFNVSGGTERVKYFVSLGVFTQDGMLDTSIYDPGYSYQIAFRRYNMRSNFDINVTKNLLLSIDVSNQMGNLQNPNWNTKYSQRLPEKRQTIAFPFNHTNIPEDNEKLINTILKLNDYKLLGEIDKENKAVQSWINYKEGNYSTSALLARNALEEYETKPDFSDSLYKLAYQLHYQDVINDNAKAFILDPYLVTALIREESYFNPKAQSIAGARGLMQLMPATASYIANKSGIVYTGQSTLFTPETNIKLGCAYLDYAKTQLHENDMLAVASYNGGPNAVRSWKDNLTYKNFDEFVENIPYPETREYVKKVYRSYWVYLNVY